jgi:D-glycero-alpha-D-manno-heptose-7-phosphate kinase
MKYKSVRVKVPLRISLAGGGCDFPDFFNQFESTPITSMAINSYVYVTARILNDFYDEKFRLEYYNVEHCNHVHEIKNDLIRGVLTFMEWEDPLHISLSSDIPGYSGLGTSSSFCVALLGALKYLRGDGLISSYELAKSSMAVELDILKLPMGVQDVLPASFGGLHTYSLRNGRSFSVHKQDESTINNLVREDKLFLVWSGSQRSSKSVLEEQIKKIDNNHDFYVEMRNLAINFYNQIESSSENSKQLLELLTQTITEANRLKSNMVENLYSEKSMLASNKLASLGVSAQRVVGAGNGGFILCVVNDTKVDKSEIEKQVGKIVMPYVPRHGLEVTFAE